MDAENGPDGRVEDDACRTDVGIVRTYLQMARSIPIVLRDISEIIVTAGTFSQHAAAMLNKIYLGSAIERFERMFIDVW